MSTCREDVSCLLIAILVPVGIFIVVEWLIVAYLIWRHRRLKKTSHDTELEPTLDNEHSYGTSLQDASVNPGFHATSEENDDGHKINLHEMDSQTNKIDEEQKTESDEEETDRLYPTICIGNTDITEKVEDDKQTETSLDESDIQRDNYSSEEEKDDQIDSNIGPVEDDTEQNEDHSSVDETSMDRTYPDFADGYTDPTKKSKDGEQANPSPVKTEPNEPVGQVEPNKIPYSDLDFIKEIGNGFYGTVHKGTWMDKVVAIKLLKTDKVKDSEKRKTLQDNMIKELTTMIEMAKEPHPNIVQLLGHSEHKGNTVIIMEYLHGGSLKEYLNTKTKQGVELYGSKDNSDYSLEPITDRQLLMFARDIAKGMEYLAAHNIIHRDLAARNILLDKDHQTCKVSDFGLARSVAEDEVYSVTHMLQLPQMWMAIEALKTSEFRKESDIWSYGVLLWEILTYGGTPSYDKDDVKSSYMLTHKLEHGKRLDPPESCSTSMKRLMGRCWKREPDERPKFTEIVGILETEITQLEAE